MYPLLAGTTGAAVARTTISRNANWTAGRTLADNIVVVFVTTTTEESPFTITFLERSRTVGRALVDNVVVVTTTTESFFTITFLERSRTVGRTRVDNVVVVVVVTTTTKSSSTMRRRSSSRNIRTTITVAAGSLRSDSISFRGNRSGCRGICSSSSRICRVCSTRSSGSRLAHCVDTTSVVAIDLRLLSTRLLLRLLFAYWNLLLIL